MADYFTLFSAVLENLTPAEAAWLHEQLDMDENQRFEPDAWPEWVQDHGEEFDTWPEFTFEFEGDDTQLWIYSDDDGNLEQIAELVQRFLERFRPNDCWSTQWSHTCSKPRLDAYGGGAIFVTAAETRWMGTGEWIWKQENEFKKAQAAKEILDANL